jgi:hypothetical protein
VGTAPEFLSGLSSIVSAQLTGAETTVDPSSEHGHQGNNDVFLLNEDNARFELFRSSHDLTFIYGENDLAGYYGCGGQTIYDYGTGTHFQFSELSAPIKVYGLEHDAAAVVDLFNAAQGTSLHPDGQGGTMLGAIDFVGATLAASQVHFLFSDHPLSTGGFV